MGKPQIGKPLLMATVNLSLASGLCCSVHGVAVPTQPTVPLVPPTFFMALQNPTLGYGLTGLLVMILQVPFSNRSLSMTTLLCDCQRYPRLAQTSHVVTMTITPQASTWPRLRFRTDYVRRPLA